MLADAITSESERYVVEMNRWNLYAGKQLNLLHDDIIGVRRLKIHKL